MATSKSLSKKANPTRRTTRRKTAREAAEPETTTEAAPEPIGDDAASLAATKPDAEPRRAKRSKKAKVVTALAEPAPEAAAEPSTSTDPAENGRVETLADLARAYCRALEDEGKSETTVRSYRADLALALSILGADTRLADLTPADIEGFNQHPRVTHTMLGQPKAKSGLLKHRRVLRLALAWAAGQGHITSAPIPATVDAA